MGIINKLFGKKPRVFLLKPHEIKDIIPNQGGCLATNKITYDGMKVGYMYREESNNEHDNGWRFFSGTESQEYVDDVNNTKVYDINTIANYDQAIVKYVDYPIGSELERIPNTESFQKIENSPLKKEGRVNLILLNVFYEQIMLSSDNGKSNIEHPSFWISESHKYTNIPKEEVINLFKSLIEIGFLEKVPNDEYAYRINNMMTVEKLTIVLNDK